MRVAHAGVVLTLFSCCPILWPQSSDADPAATFRLDANLVLTDVSVTAGKSAHPVGSFSAEDLDVREDGIPQTIQYLTRDTLPLSIIFLFDLTETVQPVLKPLAAGARIVLDQLRPQDEAAVMVFYSTTETIQPFTRDHDLLARAIEKAGDMESDEGTFLNEDVFQAIDVMRQASSPDTRRVLLFLTDGTSNTPSRLAQKTIGKSAPERLHTEAEATDALLRSSATATALIERSAMTDIMIATGYAMPFLNLMDHPGNIHKYAQQSGGVVMNTTARDVALRMADMIDAMRNRYTLGYRPANAVPDGKFCRVVVKLTPHFFATHPGLKPKAVAVRTKLGYYR